MTAASVGEALRPVIRHLDAVRLVAYAGATWDWHRLHHDQAWVRGRGLPGTVVDGQFFGALLAEQVQDTFGPSARVVAMSLRFSAMVFSGETVTVVGEVVGVERRDDGVTELIARQAVHSDSGTVAVKDAQTTVWVPSPGSDASRAWEAPR
jgi:acyl dehydratase